MSYVDDTNRSRAGIGVTVAVHIGLAAIALTGVRVAVAPRVPPMIAPNIPLPVERQTPLEPVARQHRIDIDVPQPVIDIDQPPVADGGTITVRAAGYGDGTSATATAGDLPIDPKPAGITRGAGIDPRFRADFQPLYPPASQRLSEEGTVVVRVVIGPDGRVERASVARSSGFARLDDAAVRRALTKWRFVPALSDGKPVASEREIPVTFRLMQG